MTQQLRSSFTQALQEKQGLEQSKAEEEKQHEAAEARIQSLNQRIKDIQKNTDKLQEQLTQSSELISSLDSALSSWRRNASAQAWMKKQAEDEVAELRGKVTEMEAKLASAVADREGSAKNIDALQQTIDL